MRDRSGTAVPGYGWMFPCGDGTVNIGVGALSTMKRFSDLNLNTLLDDYRALVRDEFDSPKAGNEVRSATILRCCPCVGSLRIV